MNVITSFKEKKREKQITYERKMLRELSLEKLKKHVHECFDSFYRTYRVFPSVIEDGCVDIAIEAYLLGASYSRFGYYGEPMEMVRRRSEREEKYLIDTLFDFLCFWGNIDDVFVGESLYYMCEHYISHWWIEGFEKGKKRRRLKLH
ncbi:YbaK family protein [Thermaerobacillus caldiproteolyticus]|uniref:YbaK family protein n=1 Tax=Thermaerobacillus caldiproteolyticus TaxID=247480 RepID=UPI00188A8F84|nr:YbaK family protein [Anoxybacillus caldiproteolyticus]QPA31093.1 YbaK family protein [Anoxybacillus caldiproteolyticus]